jgi:hypothetical protein
MLNNQFMNALAQLESVSYTQQERDTINAVRGKYVAKFGTENMFVRTLAQLEAVAATQAEKDEINMIRGKFGLMEMQSDIATVEQDDVDTFDTVDTDKFKEQMSTSAFPEEKTAVNWDYVNNTPVNPADRKKMTKPSYGEMDWSGTINQQDIDQKLVKNNLAISDDPKTDIDDMGVLSDYDETRQMFDDPETIDDY